jgi:predicted RNA polymerase sigma factor
VLDVWRENHLHHPVDENGKVAVSLREMPKGSGAAAMKESQLQRALDAYAVAYDAYWKAEADLADASDRAARAQEAYHLAAKLVRRELERAAK